MTVPAGTKTLTTDWKSIKHGWYVCHLNTAHLLKTVGVSCQKTPKNYQNLDFHHLKLVYKMLRLEIFPIFENIFTAIPYLPRRGTSDCLQIFSKVFVPEGTVILGCFLVDLIGDYKSFHQQKLIKVGISTWSQ